MKTILLLLILASITEVIVAQIPKSGTYIYNYCDVEYGTCLKKCKIRIQGNKIWVYAPANLTLTKEGDALDSGIIFKHSPGKWVIRHPKKKPEVELFENSNNPVSWIDFKKKQFWTF